MNVMLMLSRDDIQKEIPYGIVCETRESSRWETGRRKRLWNEMFNDKEKEACTRLFRNAKTWYLVKGVPEKLALKPSTLLLWKKLGDFCAAI